MYIYIVCFTRLKHFLVSTMVVLILIPINLKHVYFEIIFVCLSPL